MNQPKDLSGKWKGEYTLGPEYEIDEGKSFEFLLELNDKNGIFTGVCIEDELKEKLSKPITISGFWKKGLISFTKHYPFLFYYNEDGEFIIDKTKQHPEIIYTGNYNAELCLYIGNFEMVVESTPKGYGWQESKLTGTWSMERIDRLN